ncbi:hypothetical protein D3C76_924420 [compost metagenome]
MDKSGKQGPNNESSRAKGQSHPQGARREAPRLSRAENYSNPKTKADQVLHQAADAVAPRPSKTSRTAAAPRPQAARGDDDLISEEQQKS